VLPTSEFLSENLKKEQIDPKLRKWLEKTNKINSGMQHEALNMAAQTN
jgi:hypothetical protein